MRGYNGPETEEDDGVEEQDGDLVEKLDENLPQQVRCYECYRHWIVTRPTLFYCESSIDLPMVDCPDCGRGMVVHFTHMRSAEVCQVVPTHGENWYLFVRPFQNFWRRLTGFYKREGSFVYE